MFIFERDVEHTRVRARAHTHTHTHTHRVWGRGREGGTEDPKQAL